MFLRKGYKMNIIQSIITVKPDVVLEKAIAAEVGGMDDKDLTESFLNQMSVQYQPTHVKKTTKVVEDLSDEGND